MIFLKFTLYNNKTTREGSEVATRESISDQIGERHNGQSDQAIVHEGQQAQVGKGLCCVKLSRQYQINNISAGCKSE